jgi:hypothetical protein
VRYGSNGLATININSTDIHYLILRDCGTAITINAGNINAGYVVCFNCNANGILYTSNVGENFSVAIEKCMICNISQKGISIEKAGNYNINNCYFNNNNYSIDIRYCSGIVEYNEFNLSNYYIYYYKNCFNNEIHYNNFCNSLMGIRPRNNINNINNNNFYGPTQYYIYILHNLDPYCFVSSDVNAINNYWAVEDIDYYLADAEDDPRCPYHIIYLPKLSNPVKNAGIQ